MERHRAYFDTPDIFTMAKQRQPKEKLVRLYDQQKLFNDFFDIKKAKKVQSEKGQGLFFSIGLFFSMTLVVLAMEWRTYTTDDYVEVANVNIFQDEFIEVPPTEQAPPEPIRKIQQPNIIEVQDEDDIIEEINLDLDINITEETVFEKLPVIVEETVPEEVAEEVFTIVEDNPEPPGGMKGFYAFINKHIKYPEQAKRTHVEGKVFTQFIVNTDGAITDITVVKGIGMGCDEEAIRVISLAEAWKPGKQRGRPVRVKMVIPINFVLAQR